MISSFFSNSFSSKDGVRPLPNLITCFLAMMMILPGLALPAEKGVILADDQGTVLYSANAETHLIPASTIKLLTSLAALQRLGPDYRFHTWIAFDKTEKTLYIKGFGDPLFISEEIARLCTEVVRKFRPARIEAIVLDQGFFASDIVIPGTGNSKNPYDATTGALCANFNTVFFKKIPGQSAYISAEPQTPLLPVFQAQLRSSGLAEGRILLEPSQRRLYPGWLMRHFLQTQGVIVGNTVISGTFLETGDKLIFKSSFTLDQVVEKLLTYSNNFIANQLMLHLGARQARGPATLKKGLDAVTTYARNHLKLTEFNLAEGSGLSRKNRITPAQMLTLVQAFKPYHRLMKKGDHEYYKTGTLSDVRTRAGFFETSNGRLFPYVIMLNNTSKGYEAIHRELRLKFMRAGRAEE